MLLLFCFLAGSTYASRTSRGDYVETLSSKEQQCDNWSSWIYCNNDQFAEGFQLKVEGSNFGATGFKLLCEGNDILHGGNDNSQGSLADSLLHIQLLHRRLCPKWKTTRTLSATTPP